MYQYTFAPYNLGKKFHNFRPFQRMSSWRSRNSCMAFISASSVGDCSTPLVTIRSELHINSASYNCLTSLRSIKEAGWTNWAPAAIVRNIKPFTPESRIPKGGAIDGSRRLKGTSSRVYWINYTKNYVPTVGRARPITHSTACSGR